MTRLTSALVLLLPALGCGPGAPETVAWQDPIDRIVATLTGGCFLTKKGDVVRFDRRQIERIAQPGPCEVIARTSDGNVLGSFRGKGILERRDDQWQLRCPYPYDEKEGKHWVFLAEDKGRIAFATGEDSKVVDWEKGTQMWSGTSAVWVLKGDVLERVRLE